MAVANSQTIGRIIRLQVQASSIKIGERPLQTYTLDPLTSVDELHLSNHGVWARGDAGPILDVHHSDHQSSKNRRMSNGISIGFTSHYHQLRARFGNQVPDGCAGENIIVESGAIVALRDLRSELEIKSPEGLLRCSLRASEVITPCRTFSRYLLGEVDPSTEKLKEALRFLGDGMRGFFLVLKDRAHARICLGDDLLVNDGLG